MLIWCLPFHRVLVPPSLARDPLCASRSRGRVEIICHGGVRRGSDIVEAAAGATAAMARRACLYALGAAGERGVDRLLEWLRADLTRTMSLLGAGTVADLDRALLDLPT